MIIDSKVVQVVAGHDGQDMDDSRRPGPPPAYTPTPSSDPFSPPIQPQTSYNGQVPDAQAGRHHGRDISHGSAPYASVPSTSSQPVASPMLSPQVQEALVGSQYQQRLLARCARGDHDPKTEYGVCGIITAVICFPIGLICLFSDREVKCARCGVRI